MPKRISSYILLICSSFILLACATTEKYEAILNTWLNQSESHLIEKWGPPASVYELEGAKYLTYSNTSSCYVPGISPYYQTTMVGKTAYTTPYGGSPGYTYTRSCTTVFIIKNSKITSWGYKGNACKSE